VSGRSHSISEFAMPNSNRGDDGIHVGERVAVGDRLF
jgi:hypothetical protein